MCDTDSESIVLLNSVFRYCVYLFMAMTYLLVIRYSHQIGNGNSIYVLALTAEMGSLRRSNTSRHT